MNPEARCYSFLEGELIKTTKEILERYISRMTWPDDPERQVECVVDVGCGSGRATKEAVLACIPGNVQVKISALDLSENMIRVARKKYSDPRIEFVVADISEEWHSFHPEWRGKFSKAFAHYSLHWVRDIGLTMRNISNILQPGGYFFAQIMLQSCLRRCQRTQEFPKMEPILQSNGRLPPLIECDFISAKEHLLKSVQDVGLHVLCSEIEVEAHEFPAMDQFKDTIRSLGPFYLNIPDELKEEYVEENAQNIISILGTRKIQGVKFSILARKDI